jgi:hypothetical protein
MGIATTITSTGGDPTTVDIERHRPPHLPALDGFRGVAILLIFLVHFAGSEIDPRLDSGSMLDRLLVKVAVCGGSGVDLFFVLSGFLITRVLLAKRGAPRFLGNFYMRRFLRIFPPILPRARHRAGDRAAPGIPVLRGCDAGPGASALALDVYG